MKNERVPAGLVAVGWSILRPRQAWKEITGVRRIGYAFPENVVIEMNTYSSEVFDKDELVTVRKWREVLVNELLGSRTSWDDYGESSSTVVYWRTVVDATRAEVMRQAERRYGTYCKHEYDCCGNMYYHVSHARKVKGGEWAVTIIGVRNI